MWLVLNGVPANKNYFFHCYVALMYATVFGNMVAIVQRLYSKASRFHTEMNKIKEFLRFYKIPEDLRRSIQTYVRQEWTFTEGVDAQKVCKFISNSR